MNYVGYIYKCTCIINDKKYIGQTYQNYKDRWRDHIKESFCENAPGYNFHFHRAIRKYGKENFNWEIIEVINSESLDNLRKELDKLEIHYIKLYDSYHNGYNSTEGGDTSKIEQKRVVSYTEYGDILRNFDNVNEASAYYNIKKEIIWTICGRFQYYTLYNNKKIVFRYEGDDYTEEEISKVKSINYDKIVLMFDLDGKLVKTYDNPSDASKDLQLKNIRITTCCRRDSAFVLVNNQRYIFRYYGDVCTEEDLEKAKNIKSDPKTAVRAIDTITEEVLGEFKTQAEAAKFFDIKSSSNIGQVCKGNRKTYGKYNGHPIRWEFINEQPLK